MQVETQHEELNLTKREKMIIMRLLEILTWTS